jgi:hypothetical protein
MANELVCTETISFIWPVFSTNFHSRISISSPFMQALVVCAVVICGPGLNGAVLDLGAGGSHPSNIPIVDKVNIVGSSVTIIAGLFGGSINNQIGPRYTLMLAASGYPVYLGALWWLDKGSGAAFAYFAGVWHGRSAALLYSTTGEDVPLGVH